MDNSDEVVFIPENRLETGTIYIVFCASGHAPKAAYGEMECDENGYWINSPKCIKQPTVTTAEPTSINNCTDSLSVENSESVTFIPPNDHQTGTVFIVFCKPGFDPERAFGAMECNEEGDWTNVPVCSQSTSYQETTTQPDPSELQTTGAIQYETTTTEFIFTESDKGNLYSCDITSNDSFRKKKMQQVKHY